MSDMTCHDCLIGSQDISQQLQLISGFVLGFTFQLLYNLMQHDVGDVMKNSYTFSDDSHSHGIALVSVHMKIQFQL